MNPATRVSANANLAVVLFACSVFAAPASADFHAYVASTYGSVPYALSTYDPTTGESGRFSAVPSGASKLLGSPDGSELWIIGYTGYELDATGYVAVFLRWLRGFSGYPAGQVVTTN